MSARTFSAPNFECLTALVSGDHMAPVIARISRDSRWMEVTPVCDDQFEVTVKNEPGARDLFLAGTPMAVHLRGAAAEFPEVESRPPVEGRPFFRTTVTYEVLSDHASVASWPLAVIARECDEGGCSGAVKSVAVEQLTPAEMSAALISQGSDPDFFQLGEVEDACGMNSSPQP